MAVTNYSERQHGDPDVEVQFDHDGQTVTGFIDARRQHDGAWEAWVWFSYDDNGWRATRKDWIRMDALTVLTIDAVPADRVTPPAAPGPSGQSPGGVLTCRPQTPEAEARESTRVISRELWTSRIPETRGFDYGVGGAVHRGASRERTRTVVPLGKCEADSGGRAAVGGQARHSRDGEDPVIRAGNLTGRVSPWAADCAHEWRRSVPDGPGQSVRWLRARTRPARFPVVRVSTTTVLPTRDCLMKLFVSITDSTGGVLPLDLCPGVRDWWEGPSACPPGCVAHFDAWVDPGRYSQRTGGAAYSPYPNSVLSWVGGFPGVASEIEWTSRGHGSCTGLAPGAVRGYRVGDLVCDAAGRPIPVRVVVVDDADRGLHYASMFTHAAAAAAFAAAEIREREADCECAYLD